jgi:hypothetical protein
MTTEAMRRPQTATIMKLRRKRPPSTMSKIKEKTLEWG